MKSVEIRPNNWVVQHPNGIARPGVHATEEAANLSMYIPAQKLQANYTPMRDGGSPFTVEDIRALQIHGDMK